MSVLSASVVGITARPVTGSLPCGFMRPIRHHCKDVLCPFNLGMVMVFAPDPASAILACRRLWDADGKMILLQRFRVSTETLRIANTEIEEGLLKDNPLYWAYLRSMAREHETAAVLLTNLHALISYAGSPGEMWVPEGDPQLIPASAEPSRPTFEHESWWGLDLEDPDDLIDGV